MREMPDRTYTGSAEERESPTRAADLDLLRIAASFFVILLHCSAQCWAKVPHDSAQFLTLNVYDGISRWGVGIFFMISGALFLSKERSLSRIWKKNIPRLGAAFVFWSALYAALVFLRTKDIRQAGKSFLSGEPHLWFLLVLAGLYIIVPLLRRITAERRDAEYFLLLSFAASVLLPQLAAVLSLFHGTAGSALRQFVNRFNFQFAVGYVFHFVLGWYLRTYPPGEKAEKALLCGCIFGFPLTVGLTQWVTLRGGKQSEVFYGNLTLNVVMEAVFVYLLFRRLFGARSFGEKAGARIRYLADRTFVIYLVHPLIITGLAEVFGEELLVQMPVIAVPCLAVLTAVLSYGVSAVAARIRLPRRNVSGC